MPKVQALHEAAGTAGRCRGRSGCWPWQGREKLGVLGVSGSPTVQFVLFCYVRCWFVLVLVGTCRFLLVRAGLRWHMFVGDGLMLFGMSTYYLFHCNLV